MSFADRSAPKKEQFTIHLAPWTIELIKAIAKTTGETEGEVARWALKDGLLSMAGVSIQSANQLMANSKDEGS